MILIGQYDSPFVRRVAVAMTLYRLAYEHRPWSTFGEPDKIRPYSPLLRVPVLVLDSDEALIESHLIIGHVDSIAPDGAHLWPDDERQHAAARRIVGLATGISDKGVSLFYELVLHDAPSESWAGRCRQQIEGGLRALEEDRATRGGDYLFGGRIGHADIAVAAMLGHLQAAHPGLIDMTGLPALQRHSERLEALPVFRDIQQPFIPPA